MVAGHLDWMWSTWIQSWFLPLFLTGRSVQSSQIKHFCSFQAVFFVCFCASFKMSGGETEAFETFSNLFIVIED